MSYSIADLPGVFKRRFPDGLEDLVLDEDPLLGRIAKTQDFYGSGYELAWRVNNGGRVSGTFAEANTNHSQSDVRRPIITRSRLYVVGEIDHEDMEAAENNAGAIVDLVEEATLNKMDALKKRASSCLWGIPTAGAAGTGVVAIVGGGVTTTTITITNVGHMVNIQAGDILQAVNPGTGALRAGRVTVTVANAETGELTAAADWDDAGNIPAIAANDWLVPVGDYQLIPQSVFSWIPLALPAVGGATFFGVDRGGSIEMCGMRHAPGTGTYTQTLLNAMALHSRMGGKHDELYLNPIDWAILQAEQNNWQRFTSNAIGSNGTQIASISFEAIVLNGDRGPVKVYASPYCPPGYALLTLLLTWKFKCLKQMFRLLTTGANAQGMVREGGAEASRLRFGGRYQLENKQPKHSMVITLPAQG